MVAAYLPGRPVDTFPPPLQQEYQRRRDTAARTKWPIEATSPMALDPLRNALDWNQKMHNRYGIDQLLC